MINIFYHNFTEIRMCIFEYRPFFVIGDFNYQASEENMLSTFLHSKGLMQIVKRPTHVDGGIIDHCYVPSEWKNTINAEYFFTYYTDHAREDNHT